MERKMTASALAGRRINEIIVHCTATSQGEDYCVAQLRSWHRRLGFSDVGYHYVVRLDGTVETGRPETQAGAHCKAHNRNSIGVCYVGGCAPRSVRNWQQTAVDTRTAAQRRALTVLIARLKCKYPGATVYGHRDFAAKACPCFDAHTEYASL